MEPVQTSPSRRLDQQPVGITEAVRLLLVSLLVLIEAFGWASFTPGQYTALLGVYAAVSVLLSLIAHRRTTPSRTAQR